MENNAGFEVVCCSCGAKLTLPNSVGEPDKFENEDIQLYVDVYETINITCRCGNIRE